MAKHREGSRKRGKDKQASVGELVAALADEEIAAPPPVNATRSAPADAVDLAAPTVVDSEDATSDPDEVRLVSELPMDADDDLSKVEGEASPRLANIVESLLFAADRPLRVKDIRKLLKEPSIRQVQLALKDVQARFADRGMILVQVAGGFRLSTHPENARWVQQLLAAKPSRLSRSQLEALAVIAYRQPITKAEIDHVRGVDCSAVLRLLLERNLVQIVGRKEEPGRPHVYGTTVEFLEFFNLRGLGDLPDLREFRELSEESKATLHSRLGADPALVAEALGQERLDLEGTTDDCDPEAEQIRDDEVVEIASDSDGEERA